MKTIASFTVDHDVLEPGMYVSRIDGDVVTYDLRMVKPNGGEYLPNPAMHTFEHLFATYVRNSQYSQQIVYVGPMGCRTGLYFLTRDAMSRAEALQLVQECFAFIAQYEGEIPGNQPKECGNYREHDLEGAKSWAARMCQVLKTVTPETMDYASSGV